MGAILTGGQSRRFGTDKARRIGPIVLRAMREAGVDPVVTVGGATDVLPVPNLADRYPGEGPLGGLATALTYARRGWVLVTPCDHPRLLGSHLEPLLHRLITCPTETALIASIDGEPVHSIACWPAAWARPTHDLIRTGERRFGAAAGIGSVELIAIDPIAAVDADDPAALDALLADEPPNGAA